MKIGIIYSKKGQVLPLDMLTTDSSECSDQFVKFVDLLGTEIDLENSRGDMCKDNERTMYHEFWKNIDVVYHVAPFLSEEIRYRIIGNDVALIFFLEEGTFDPSHIEKLGSRPQIFAVVQPKLNDLYQVAFFCNTNIKPFDPSPPIRPLLPKELKEILLTKLFNGLMMTTYCPPLNRLFYQPRNLLLQQIISKYPNESKKERKAREKQERKQLQVGIFPDNKSWFKVTVTLITKDQPDSPVDSQKELKLPHTRECLLCVNIDGIRVHDIKSKQKVYHWNLMQVSKWSLYTPPKSLTIFLAGYKEAILIKSSEARTIESLITHYLAQLKSTKE